MEVLFSKIATATIVKTASEAGFRILTLIFKPLIKKLNHEEAIRQLQKKLTDLDAVQRKIDEANQNYHHISEIIFENTWPPIDDYVENNDEMYAITEDKDVEFDTFLAKDSNRLNLYIEKIVKMAKDSNIYFPKKVEKALKELKLECETIKSLPMYRSLAGASHYEKTSTEKWDDIKNYSSDFQTLRAKLTYLSEKIGKTKAIIKKSAAV